MGEYISIFASIIAIFSAYLVVISYGSAFLPKKHSSVSWLSHAICAGAVTFALNAIYWSVLMRVSLINDCSEILTWLINFGAYVDFVLRGALPAWVAFAHLKARHLGLPEEERKEWRIWEMPFHPKRNAFLRRVLP